MRKVEICLSDDVYSYIELRCAIDDMRVPEGLEKFLTELAGAKLENRAVVIE